jgi:hypothetical protein
MSSTINGAITPSFFFPCLLCYDTSCQQVDVPWVGSFQEVLPGVSACVLPQAEGTYAPGFYVRETDSAQWRYALSYNDVCGLVSPPSTLQVVLHSTTSQTVALTDTLFLNGFQLPNGTNITAHPAGIYCWVRPANANTFNPNYQPLTDMFGTPIGTYFVQ